MQREKVGLLDHQVLRELLVQSVIKGHQDLLVIMELLVLMEIKVNDKILNANTLKIKLLKDKRVVEDLLV